MLAEPITSDRVMNFVMPECYVGQTVLWYSNGKKDGNEPGAAVVTKKSRTGRSIEVKVQSTGVVYDACMHVSDPKLEISPDHRLDGAWDYTEQDERFRALEEHVKELTMLVNANQAEAYPVEESMPVGISPDQLGIDEDIQSEGQAIGHEDAAADLPTRDILGPLEQNFTVPPGGNSGGKTPVEEHLPRDATVSTADFQKAALDAMSWNELRRVARKELKMNIDPSLKRPELTAQMIIKMAEPKTE